MLDDWPNSLPLVERERLGAVSQTILSFKVRVPRSGLVVLVTFSITRQADHFLLWEPMVVTLDGSNITISMSGRFCKWGRFFPASYGIGNHPPMGAQLGWATIWQFPRAGDRHGLGQVRDWKDLHHLRPLGPRCAAVADLFRGPGRPRGPMNPTPSALRTP